MMMLRSELGRTVLTVLFLHCGRVGAQGNPGNGAFGDTTDTSFTAGPTGTSTTAPSIQDLANNTSHTNVIILIVILAVAFAFILLGAVAYNLRVMKGRMGGRDMFNPAEDPADGDGGLAQNTRRNAATVGGLGHRSRQNGGSSSDGLWAKVASPFSGKFAKGRRSNRDRDAWKGLHGEDAEEMWDDRLDDSEVHRLGTLSSTRHTQHRGPQGPFGDIPDHEQAGYEDPFSTDPSDSGQYMAGNGRALESTISLHAPGDARAMAPPAYEGDAESMDDDHKSASGYDYYAHERDH